MKIKVKTKHFYTYHVWFENDIEKVNLENYRGGDNLLIHGNDKPIENIDKLKCNVNKQFTLLTDLKENEEDIFKKFSKTVRYEINKSSKENISYKVFINSEIEDNLLNSFNVMYNEMYNEKGMPNHWLPLNELKEYAKQKVCMISVAYYNNEPLVYHSYIFDKDNSRFLHSCSSFRSQEKNSKRIIGMANKFLMWNDMLWFKNKKVSIFDWGGISSFDNPNGIDEFKFAFGGTKKTYFNITLSFSLRAKLWNKIRKIK